MEYYCVINLNILHEQREDVSSLDIKNRVRFIYHTEDRALAEARDQATQAPRASIAIFKAIRVVETKSPTYIDKVFNDRGELVPG